MVFGVFVRTLKVLFNVFVVFNGYLQWSLKSVLRWIAMSLSGLRTSQGSPEVSANQRPYSKSTLFRTLNSVWVLPNHLLFSIQPLGKDYPNDGFLIFGKANTSCMGVFFFLEGLVRLSDTPNQAVLMKSHPFLSEPEAPPAARRCLHRVPSSMRRLRWFWGMESTEGQVLLIGPVLWLVKVSFSKRPYFFWGFGVRRQIQVYFSLRVFL